MRILAVDTSTKSCSVAIVEERTLLAEATLLSGQTHSKHLMRMINKVIGMSRLRITDIDGYGFTRGPGTFTGLRIGISSIKGLAVASGKPIAGVSSLDALALQVFPSSGLICSLLDARRGEVYCSRYRLENRVLKKEGKERVLPPQKAVGDINEPCVFIGNGATLYKKLIEDTLNELAYFAPFFQNTIRASTVAHLCMDRFKKNDIDDVGRSVPRYLRKSDAELNLTAEK
jgi:tRNA threonylcarbamoyladenosine biosynthesis protein TsaB